MFYANLSTMGGILMRTKDKDRSWKLYHLSNRRDGSKKHTFQDLYLLYSPLEKRGLLFQVFSVRLNAQLRRSQHYYIHFNNIIKTTSILSREELEEVKLLAIGITDIFKKLKDISLEYNSVFKNIKLVPVFLTPQTTPFRTKYIADAFIDRDFITIEEIKNILEEIEVKFNDF